MPRRRAVLAALAATGLGGCVSRLNDLDGDGVPDSDDPAPFDASEPGGDGSGASAPKRSTPVPVDSPRPDSVSDPTRVWPVASDASEGYCRDADGNRESATGPDSATWFAYNGCGSWKTFPTVPGDRYRLEASTDSGLLTDAAFVVEERTDGSWVRRGGLDRSLGADATETVVHGATSRRLRVVNVDTPDPGIGFYLAVYRLPG